MSKHIISLPVESPLEISGGGNSLTIHHVGMRGDKGDRGDIAIEYIHEQSSASSEWVINHNLGRKPAIVLLTVGGVEFNGQIIHTSINQATVYLAVNTAGTVICN